MKKTKTRLIITADDYGFCNEVDKGILDAAKNGLISSVAALPNGPNNTDRLGFLKTVQDNYTNGSLQHSDSKINHLEVGCHFTITSGKAITDAAREDWNLSEDGYFRKYTQMRRPRKRSELVHLNKVLKNELEAQLEVCKSVIKVNHLSSHHDSLIFFPDYYQTFLDVARKFGIPVRSPAMIPDKREKVYYGQIGFRNRDNLSRRMSREYREFRLNRLNNENDVTGGHPSPDYLFGGNYVTRNIFLGIWEKRAQEGVVAAKMRKHYKASNNYLESFDDNLPLAATGKTIEICAHLCTINDHVDFTGDGPIYTRKTIGGKPNSNYYPGVTSGYFDGRQIEYRLLEKLKKRIYHDKNVEIGSWNTLK